MLLRWVKSFCGQLLISILVVVVFLMGHYLTYLLVSLNRGVPAPENTEYLAVLDEDLHKITSRLPFALSHALRSYRRHDTYIRSVFQSVLSGTASAAYYFVFNHATVLVVSCLTRLSILCGYVFVFGAVVALIGPVVVSGCVWVAVLINVVVHLCNDAGVFLAQLLVRSEAPAYVTEGAPMTPTSVLHGSTPLQDDTNGDTSEQQGRSPIRIDVIHTETDRQVDLDADEEQDIQDICSYLNTETWEEPVKTS